MARRTVEIRGLTEMAAAFEQLGKHAFGDAVQEALNDTAADAVGRMAVGFETSIDDGPVDFTRPVKGSTRSSVLSSRQRGATKGQAESSVKVQAKQSAYLKYALGEDESRPAGDVGAAEEYNFVPIPGELARAQGIHLTPEGSLPKNTLRTLIRRAQSQRGRDRAKLAKKGPVTDEALKALRIKRKKRLGLKRVDQFVGDKRSGGRNDSWFGKRKGAGGRLGRTVGFWGRPANRKGEPRLLVAAVPRSRYDGHLVEPWNDAVVGAADTLPRTMERRLGVILDRLVAARAARRRR